jgi:chromosomal replication initiation ATPase DnaA
MGGRSTGILIRRPPRAASTAPRAVGRTLTLQGPPSVGKTHLAIALGVKAVQNGFSVAFFRLEELLLALRERSWIDRMRMLRSSSALARFDWGRLRRA